MTTEFFLWMDSTDVRDRIATLRRTDRSTARDLARALAATGVKELKYSSLRSILANPMYSFAIAINHECLLVVAIDLPGKSLDWQAARAVFPPMGTWSEERMIGYYPASDSYELLLKRDGNVIRHVAQTGDTVDTDFGTPLGVEWFKDEGDSEPHPLNDYDRSEIIVGNALPGLMGIQWEDPSRDLWMYCFQPV